ncbi:hypothetical protein FO519_008584 [Halicephalobus sp. NKZ332]|nr:hypothetical protein FO519_008584 [Halicephalobus sp. NKZ332]
MNAKDFPIEYFYNEIATKFNMIFTTITALITVSMAPFYLYIVLTQSKSLGTYRFFILNHSIWTICAEICFGFSKTCMLMPGTAGFILGPLGKIGGIKMTTYFFLVDCLFMLFTIIGMTMSLIYRYTSIFPGRTKEIGTSKWMIVTCLIIQLAISVLLCIIADKFLSLDHDTMARKAIEFSPALSKFTNEPTFVFIDREFGFPMVIAVWITLIIISVLFGIVATTLFFELKHNRYAVKKLELQKTLILSCIVQIGITIVFLFIPIMVFFYYLTFGYVYAGPITMIVFCVFCLHAIAEMVATIYFVLPYRRFVMKRLLNIRQEKSNTVVPSLANTFNKF